MTIIPRFIRLRPVIEPQVEPADCGYVCMSAILALMGQPITVADIKRVAGTTARGLTIKQVRDGLGRFDVRADAVFFDKSNVRAYPDLGILLLDRGHFVVVARKRRHMLEIYDPMIGWSWINAKRLARSLSGFAILVHNPDGKAPGSLRPRSYLRQLMKSTLEGSLLRRALLLFAGAQLVALALPLVTMRAVDGTVRAQDVGFGGAVLIGFLALSFVNALSVTVGEFVQATLKRKMNRRLGGVTFDSLLAKQAAWFDSLSGASIQNQITSLQLHLDFVVDALRACASLAITIVAGLGVLLFISPWLAVPGLVSLVLRSGLDIFLTRRQRGLMSLSVESGQRRQAFVLGTLVQIPLMVRHGSARHCRARYVQLMARVGNAAGALQVLQGWRTTLTALLKSCETIIFVTIAAWFMRRGEYSIGGFVAVGAYKDLLAGALSSAFQLWMRHDTMAIHRIQGGMLLEERLNGATQPTAMEVQEGHIAVRGVSYRYGSLDELALRDVDFRLAEGECLVVKGQSGSGKSTLAKLLTGVIAPTTGDIEIDGKPLAYPVHGLAAVLQSDRLISGTIRENISLYRPGVSDSEIWRALQICLAEAFVRDLPMRLNMLVGEGMSGLSGGQRQRLLLARAVVGSPRILLLDEATASLDVETEAAIMRNLRHLGVTLVVISHRPEVWKFADRMIELSGGQMAATPSISDSERNSA
jgi:ATP-binding cassette subfamily B protein RaxB